tara:strand:+ start:121235 stop:122767 length:1533 start_codon:yes stop_codon:yes gene_type:complete
MVNVFFLGKDSGYYQTIKEIFDSEYTGEEFQYKEQFPDDVEEFHQVVIEIKKFKADIVFLDYGMLPEKVLTVARTLQRAIPSLKSVIGLWDFLSTKKLIDEGNITGVSISHIKSGEVGDVVHHAMQLYTRAKFNMREFAKADKCFNVEVEVQHQMKIGFITPEYVHVEHDLYPCVKAPFQLKTYFGKVFPITHFKIERKINSDFYYHYKYSSDLSYSFEALFNIVGEESEKEKRWRLNHQKDVTANRKKQIEKFFDTYPHSSVPKRTKLLVIDDELRIFKQSKIPLDHYPYSIRVYSSLEETPDVIDREMPGVVAIQCPKGSEGDLSLLIESIEKHPNHLPFIVVFNSHWGTEKLKEHFKYQKIIAHTEDFELELVLNLCEAYTKSGGREKSHHQADSTHKDEKRIYIPKNRSESYIDYDFKILLNTITEAYLTFQCHENLSFLTPYNIRSPFQFSITVIEKIDEPDWCFDSMNQYLAVIHCIGENEKSALRRKVNEYIQMANEKENEEK